MGYFLDPIFFLFLKSTVLPNSLWENKHSLRRVRASQLSDVHLFPSFVHLFTPAILSLICCLFVSSSPLQFFLFRSLYNLPCLSTQISLFLVLHVQQQKNPSPDRCSRWQVCASRPSWWCSSGAASGACGGASGDTEAPSLSTPTTPTTLLMGCTCEEVEA